MPADFANTEATLLAATQLVACLHKAGKRVALAESCTGGAVAQALTQVAGASAVFEYGFVVYGNSAKEKLLGVAPVSLKQEGAVSASVAEQMALGAHRRAGADFALALTGIAGPAGGSPAKPVGLVWFALVQKKVQENAQEKAQSLCQVFDGTRTEIRQQATLFALAWLLQVASE